MFSTYCTLKEILLGFIYVEVEEVQNIHEVVGFIIYFKLQLPVCGHPLQQREVDRKDGWRLSESLFMWIYNWQNLKCNSQQVWCKLASCLISIYEKYKHCVKCFTFSAITWLALLTWKHVTQQDMSFDKNSNQIYLFVCFMLLHQTDSKV